MTKHHQNVERILQQELRSCALTAGRRARSMLQKALPGWERKIASAEELDLILVQWADRHVAKRVTEITRTTAKRIASIVGEGLINHDPPSTIARDIRSRMPEFSPVRAETIARTETAAAVQTAQFEEMSNAQDELGVKMKKTWIATEDDRTRETHSEADGQQVRLDDKFAVGDALLDFPSDPDGPPEEVINCRCAIGYDME